MEKKKPSWIPANYERVTAEGAQIREGDYAVFPDGRVNLQTHDSAFIGIDAEKWEGLGGMAAVYREKKPIPAPRVLPCKKCGTVPTITLYDDTFGQARCQCDYASHIGQAWQSAERTRRSVINLWNRIHGEPDLIQVQPCRDCGCIPEFKSLNGLSGVVCRCHVVASQYGINDAIVVWNGRHGAMSADTGLDLHREERTPLVEPCRRCGGYPLAETTYGKRVTVSCSKCGFSVSTKYKYGITDDELRRLVFSEWNFTMRGVYRWMWV